MQNIIKIFSLFALLCPLWLSSECFKMEFRAGYFVPSSSVMRDIYHHGGPEAEWEGAAHLNDDVDVWLNFNYFERNGHSLGLGDKTSIRLFPLSIGIKHNFCLTDQITFYLGIGASYTWLRTHDHSDFVQRHTRRQGWGGVGKSGFIYNLADNLFLDLFFDYYYTSISGVHHSGVEATSRDVGGLRTGLGLGINF